MSHFKNATIFICHEIKQWLISFSWLFYLYSSLLFRPGICDATSQFWSLSHFDRRDEHLTRGSVVQFYRSLVRKASSRWYLLRPINLPQKTMQDCQCWILHSKFLVIFGNIFSSKKSPKSIRDFPPIDHGQDHDNDWPERIHLLKNCLFMNFHKHVFMFVRASFWTRTFQWNLVMPDYGRL